ncbi:hypothetical protein [Mesorhizobium sp.]|uniref:hypothetical protein n=1 Tax=Mesorhizobium sp. TaxID=1871066 RepID=UPI0025F379B6|nr:hypothetical protein [Mesorhizobium sp.]
MKSLILASLFSMFSLALTSSASADWWVEGEIVNGNHTCWLTQTPDSFSPGNKVVKVSTQSSEQAQYDEVLWWLYANHKQNSCAHNRTGLCYAVRISPYQPQRCQ